jgi:hypothetical protein
LVRGLLYPETMRRLTRALFLFVASLAVGCTTTYHVTRPVNAEAFEAVVVGTQAAPVTLLYAASKAQPKDRVSATPESPTIARGDLLAFTPLGPIAKASSGDLQLTLGDLRGYQVPRHGRGAAEGLGVGLLLGGTLGVVAGLAAGTDPPCMSTELFGCLGNVRMTAREKATVGGIALGATGAVVGAIFGAITGHTDAYVF